jgi:hypothetical protein
MGPPFGAFFSHFAQADGDLGGAQILDGDGVEAGFAGEAHRDS